MVVSQCYSCRHFDTAWTCTAFRRIPIEVIQNEKDHRNAVEGDHGIRWEPIESGIEAKKPDSSL
jgi:hypothetical protein